MIPKFRPSIGKTFRGQNNTQAGRYRTSNVRDLGNALDNLRSFISHMKGVTPVVLEEAIRPTFNKALDYCPEDTGTLVESGFLEVSSNRYNAFVAIGFAKNNFPKYAVYVHEMPYYHNKGRAKFLQDAVDEDTPEFPERVASLLKEAAGT